MRTLLVVACCSIVFVVAPRAAQDQAPAVGMPGKGEGRVTEDIIEGTVTTSGRKAEWRATR
jgi:hypothetical protein